MTVKVAIDLALDRLFTYEVPEALKGKLAVGQLLSVPFGHREARGFAMELVSAERTDASAAASAQYKLKPINAIVDEVPFFSLKLLELVKMVSRYTASPLESVLKAALPAVVIRKNTRAKELLFVEPALSRLPVELTPRQQWLCDQIRRLGGGWMSQLCKELKTTPSSVRQLGLKGVVTIEPRAKRRDPLAGGRILPTKPLSLNAEQTAALKTIGECSSVPILLFGVTGSGKTEVYLQAIASELEAGRGAIVMVPEISLTPQTVRRFASRFGNRVAVLHSALSDGERYDEWHRIRSGEARVVVGPRSAVWAPVKDLGLIVVDEEHEGSYKQDDSPRYHGRDVAVLRGKIEGAKVVLGSATPSLESWRNAQLGKYRIVTMSKRAGLGSLPRVSVVDMTPKEGAIFSSELLEAIRLRLERKEQVILFLNRRGYSRTMVCDRCGYVMECPQCSRDERAMPYTYHRADNCLRCHVCGGWMEMPDCCPQCHGKRFSYQGIGTQRAEAALKRCFNHAAILRMDADSTSRKNSHDDILSAFRRHDADILIGTQMIAKGLDFPNVTLVGVLNADSSLAMPDFRAAERTYQLLAQVSGRAGRAELPGETIIQTHNADDPTIMAAAIGDYLGFARKELEVRSESFFPPFCHLSVLSVKGKDESEASAWAKMYAEALQRYAAKAMEAASASGRELKFMVSSEIPSAIEKADGWFRWMVVLRSSTISPVIKAWKWVFEQRPPSKRIRVGIDIDAINVL